MSDNKPGIVIIGGGIAGLSFAYHLKQPYHLYEKEEEVGGLCRSVEIAGCTFDYAPRLLLLKDQYSTDLSCELLGENVHFLDFGDWSYHRRYDVYTRLPFQKHMYGIPMKATMQMLAGFVKTMLSPNGKDADSYQDWLYHRVGRPIADMVIVPQEHKKWKTDPATMDHRWAPGRVPRPSLKELVAGALWDTSHQRNFGYTLRGGIASLMQAFADRLTNLHVGVSLQSIDTETHTLTFNDGSQVPYDTLVSTMPLPILIRQLKTAPPDILEAANRLEHISLQCVCLVIGRENVTDKNFIYVHDPEFILHRVSFFSNLSPEMAAPGYTSLVAEVTYIDQPPLDDEALKQRVHDDLIAMHLLNDDDIVVANEILPLPMAYPKPTPDRIDTVQRIRDYLETQDIYLLGRFGEWEYVNMHDIIPRARDLALKLDEHYERVT
jgi:UDP-galactopyranose mutase